MDATERDTTLPTDIGPVREKLFGKDSSGITRIDTADFDQVFILALELHGCHRNRLFQVTHNEWRAIVRMAVLCAPVMTQVLRLADLSDAAEGSDIERAEACRLALESLLTLARTARPILDGVRHDA